MAIHSITATQLVPVCIQEAWNFFSNSGNLRKITPNNLDLIVMSHNDTREIYPGQIITYKFNSGFGMPIYWTNEITHVEREKFFVDEQLDGPFGMWHHQHHFKKFNNEVEIKDVIHYKMPLWFIGDMMHAVMVKHQLRKIFTYRFQKIEEIMGKSKILTPQVDFF